MLRKLPMASDAVPRARAAIIAVVWLLAACGAPVETTLSALSSAQEDFDGRLVVVTGTLRTFPRPRHYWIENEARDRVALEGAEIDLLPLVGRTIEVRGRFSYGREAGRRIEVESLEVR